MSKDNVIGCQIIHCLMVRSFGLLCAQSSVLFCLETMIIDNETNAVCTTVDTALFGFYVDDDLFNFLSSEDIFASLVKLGYYCCHEDYP